MNPEKFRPKNCYERLYNKPLSKKEVFEMRDSLRQFFEILIEIDQENHILKNKELNNDKDYRSSNNTN